MIVLGVTGSIAMGKSTVSTMLSHLNNPIHDADKTVHELMDMNGKAYYEIAKSFPAAVQVTGIDRAKIGREVFGNPKTLNCDRDSQGDVFYADMSASIVRPKCFDNMKNSYRSILIQQ